MRAEISPDIPKPTGIIDSGESVEQHRTSSRICRKILRGETVYDKRYLAGDWGATVDAVRRRAAREVRLVESLHRSGLFKSRLAVVEIVSAEPDAGRVITKEVAGKTLDELVGGRFRKGGVECRLAMFLAGRWLRQFQQLALCETDRQPISECDPQDLVEYGRVRLETLDTYGYHGLDGRFSDALLNRIASLVARSDERDRRMVWAHADYAPGNILWDGRTLTPIDFAMAHSDRPLLDVTYLIHRLEMQRVYRPWKRWPVEVWKRAILRGYGRPDAEESPMYRALMIRHLICRLHTYARRPPRDLKQHLHDKWVRGVIRRRLIAEAGMADRD